MKKKIIGLVVVAVVLGVILNSTSTQKEGLIIGMISTLSGDYSATGENIRNGALLAQEIYNEDHSEYPVELIVEDDGFDNKKALSAYRKLTSINNIDALITVSTPSISAIYDDTQREKLPVMLLFEETVDARDDTVVQMAPGARQMEYDLGEYVATLGYTNPAVVYNSHDVLIRFKDWFIEGYGSSVSEFQINSDETDYKSHATKVKGSDPDVVIIIMFPEAGAQFVKKYHETFGELPQLVFDANAQTGITDYQRILDGAAILDGSIIGALDNSTPESFKQQYKSRFGEEPGFGAHYGYDAFTVLVNAYHPEDSVWVENLKETETIGVSGEIKFDHVGIRLPKTIFLKIKDGKIPLVE